MSAVVVERTVSVRLGEGEPFNVAGLVRDDAEWLAVAVASAAQRHPHYGVAKRFLEALREGLPAAEGVLAEFVAARPDILRMKMVSFSTLPNKNEAASRFVRAAKDEACRITDYCGECLRSPVNCVCPRVKCVRCGEAFRGQDRRAHACGALP